MTNVELAIALANAVDDPEATGDWLAEVGGPDEPPPELGSARAAVTALLKAALAEAPLPRDAVTTANALAARAPVYPRLENGELAYAANASPDDMFLAELAAGALELVGTPSLRGRLRRCPAPSCGRFFVTGRPSRRWCSERCASRARLSRFRAARRG